MDYNAIFQVANVLAIDVTPSLLHKLQVLEETFVEEVNNGK